MTPSPWVALGARPDLKLVRAAIAEPARYYETLRTIVIRSGLLVEEERRYLWHELVHADRRDEACHMDDRGETGVEREAARRAIPLSSLEWAWPRADSWHDLGDLLKLPQEWVMWRWRIAAPSEKAIVRKARANEGEDPCEQVC